MRGPSFSVAEVGRPVFATLISSAGPILGGTSLQIWFRVYYKKKNIQKGRKGAERTTTKNSARNYWQNNINVGDPRAHVFLPSRTTNLRTIISLLYRRVNKIFSHWQKVYAWEVPLTKNKNSFGMKFHIPHPSLSLKSAENFSARVPK